MLALVFAPITACVFYVLIRGWAYIVQGNKITDATRNRQRQAFWAMLWGMYAVLACTLTYEHFGLHSK